MQFIIEETKKNQIPLVIDADGLFIVNEMPALVQGYSKAILTPNRVEFGRLQVKLGSMNDVSQASLEIQVEAVRWAAEKLGCTILRKGKEDIISDGKDSEFFFTSIVSFK